MFYRDIKNYEFSIKGSFLIPAMPLHYFPIITNNGLLYMSIKHCTFFPRQVTSTNQRILQTFTVAVAQWTRASALQAEGWMFESLPRQT